MFENSGPYIKVIETLSKRNSGMTRKEIQEATKFEQVCLYHHLQIEQKLGISGMLTETFSWRNENSQIDMVIKRSDKVINLCEIKWWE